MTFSPLYVRAPETGLIQQRPQHILPDDAYPILENAYVFRETIRRKSGARFHGRLQRDLEEFSYFPTSASPWTFNLLSISGYVANTDTANPGQVTTTAPHGLTTGDEVIISGIVGATGYNDTVFTITVVDATNFTIGVDASGFGVYVSGGFWISDALLTAATTTPLESNAQIRPGSVEIILNGTITFTDNGNGTLSSVTPGNSGTISYITGSVTLTHTAGVSATTEITYSYYPSLPVMGLLTQETESINAENTLGFDQKYAYTFIGGAWEEYIPGTVWSGTNYQFFFPLNYWTLNNRKIFWVTNFDTSVGGDPVRYTDTIAWYDFAPTVNGTNVLRQFLAMATFRNRMVVFNTQEGTLGNFITYPQRIRWSEIGNPLASDAWRDDIRGKGGYIDIPTAQSIVAIGFVRDNLVIYCERSTWQLRWTGRSVNPFQLEKVNVELGAESTFSAVQFDTSLVGIGDKGIVECDSFKSTRIDIKIVDLVYQFNNLNNGLERVYGIRDFVNKLAYWMYPDQASNPTFPNRRLIYNYENDSWAIFRDSFTCLGTYQPTTSTTWNNANSTWNNYNQSWNGAPAFIPDIIGGNQQGYTLILDKRTINDESLSISGITGSLTAATEITVINHNLQSNDFIRIIDIPSGTSFVDLNDTNYQVERIDANTLGLYIYDSNEEVFVPKTHATGTYPGGGQIKVRDNFVIRSKRFNYLQEGQQIQLGYIDVLTNLTNNGQFSLNVYVNYNETNPVNQKPLSEDTFFNRIIPTYQSQGLSSVKNIQRVYCNVRGSFIACEWTFSDVQMIGEECEEYVELSMQTFYFRKAGKQLNTIS